MKRKVSEKYLEFEFPGNDVLKLDEEPFYEKVLKTLEGTKAVDIVYVQNDKELFLIEVKDYRLEPKGFEHKELVDDLGAKFRDSMALLLLMSKLWKTDFQRVAEKAVLCKTVTLVLHAEGFTKIGSGSRYGALNGNALLNFRANLKSRLLKYEAWGCRVCLANREDKNFPWDVRSLSYKK